MPVNIASKYLDFVWCQRLLYLVMVIDINIKGSQFVQNLKETVNFIFNWTEQNYI